MNQKLTRNDRLDLLLSEQARVRRARVRRRNTGFAAAMLLLVGGAAWMLSPSQQTVQPQPSSQQASTTTHRTPEPDQATTTAPESKAFRITRIEDRSPRLTTVVQNAQPKRVEYINDLQLFIAMRAQGIDAGLMRSGGRTQLAFNDEQSRRRFEERSGSPE
jgi:hypothetical protein